MHNNQTAVLPLTVIEGEGPSLFGRNWLKTIEIDWKSFYTLKESRLQSLQIAHRYVFSDGLGKLQGDTDIFSRHVPSCTKGRSWIGGID